MEANEGHSEFYVRVMRTAHKMWEMTGYHIPMVVYPVYGDCSKSLDNVTVGRVMLLDTTPEHLLQVLKCAIKIGGEAVLVSSSWVSATSPVLHSEAEGCREALAASWFTEGRGVFGFAFVGESDGKPKLGSWHFRDYDSDVRFEGTFGGPTSRGDDGPSWAVKFSDN